MGVVLLGGRVVRLRLPVLGWRIGGAVGVGVQGRRFLERKGESEAVKHLGEIRIGRYWDPVAAGLESKNTKVS